jgi:hypothetical protein
MAQAGFFARISHCLWSLGGVSAAAELKPEDFGPGADTPCPREDEYPFCSHPEDSPCRIRSSSSSPPRQCR